MYMINQAKNTQYFNKFFFFKYTLNIFSLLLPLFAQELERTNCFSQICEILDFIEFFIFYTFSVIIFFI